MATDKLFYIGVKALIEDEQKRILLLHSYPNKWRVIKEPYWDLPGGRIQSYQGAVETLRKEITEETGLTSITDPQFITTIISKHDVSPTAGQEVGLALMIYEVKVSQPTKVTISEEHDDLVWLKKSEAAKRLGHKYPTEFTNWLASQA